MECDGPSLTGEPHDKTNTYDAVHRDADVLECYSTVPGFAAYRNTSEGSIYITTLLHVLDEYQYR